MTDRSIYLAIAVISLVTIAIRFAPFLIFGNRKTPKAVELLGKSLPYAVMGMLCVYCLKSVSFSMIRGFLPELLASLSVVVSYILRKNTLFSIILGTAVYMVLVQFVFV